MGELIGNILSSTGQKKANFPLKQSSCFGLALPYLNTSFFILYKKAQYREDDLRVKQNLIDNLKREASAIEKDATEGDDFAQKIIRYYGMWYTCPGDNMAFVLTENAYKEWLNSKRQAS